MTVWRRVMLWFCLLVVLCAAARIWQMTSDSMLVGAAPPSSHELCVRRAEVDIYTAALMDQQQLRDFEASLCQAT
jgi:hypothetical protein